MNPAYDPNTGDIVLYSGYARPENTAVNFNIYWPSAFYTHPIVGENLRFEFWNVDEGGFNHIYHFQETVPAYQWMTLDTVSVDIQLDKKVPKTLTLNAPLSAAVLNAQSVKLKWRTGTFQVTLAPATAAFTALGISPFTSTLSVTTDPLSVDFQGERDDPITVCITQYGGTGDIFLCSGYSPPSVNAVNFGVYSSLEGTMALGLPPVTLAVSLDRSTPLKEAEFSTSLPDVSMVFSGQRTRQLTGTLNTVLTPVTVDMTGVYVMPGEMDITLSEVAIDCIMEREGEEEGAVRTAILDALLSPVGVDFNGVVYAGRDMTLSASLLPVDISFNGTAYPYRSIALEVFLPPVGMDFNGVVYPVRDMTLGAALSPVDVDFNGVVHSYQDMVVGVSLPPTEVTFSAVTQAYRLLTWDTVLPPVQVDGGLDRVPLRPAVSDISLPPVGVEFTGVTGRVMDMAVRLLPVTAAIESTVIHYRIGDLDVTTETFEFEGFVVRGRVADVHIDLDTTSAEMDMAVDMQRGRVASLTGNTLPVHVDYLGLRGRTATLDTLLLPFQITAEGVSGRAPWHGLTTHLKVCMDKTSIKIGMNTTAITVFVDETTYDHDPSADDILFDLEEKVFEC